MKKRILSTLTLLSSVALGYDEGWVTAITESPLDDSKKVLLIQFSDHHYGRSGDPGSMSIECKDNTTVIKFSGDYEVGYSALAPVAYRMDRDEAVRDTWVVAGNGSSVFAAEAVSFAKKLLAAKSIYIEIPKNRYSTTSLYITLTGLDEAIKPLRKECNW